MKVVVTVTEAGAFRFTALVGVIVLDLALILALILDKFREKTTLVWTHYFELMLKS